MEVTYEVIQTTLPASGMKAPGWNSALGAGIQLAPMAFAFFRDQALNWKVNRALGRMAAELKKARGSKQGVLVLVQIREWEQPDTNGSFAKDLHEILIGPAGNDFRAVYRVFMMSPRMHSGPGAGWRLSSSSTCLWVTAP